MEDNNNLDTGTGQENTQTEEKKFTQKEVDSIVEQRLARERKKFTNMIDGKDPRETAIEEREKNVLIKELQADAKDVFRQKNFPMEALELLNYTDKESCDKSIELLEAVMNAAREKAVFNVLKGGTPPERPPQDDGGDALRSAFGLKRT